MKRIGLVAVTLSLFFVQLTGCAGGRSQSQAMKLYDEGRYTEARALLEELDAEGEATGSELYRLFYCQQSDGDGETSQKTLQRAMERLEREVEAADDLEVPFYLVNAYQNVGRADDAKRVAAQALARVESGELRKPKGGVGSFRLGKLYADQGNVEQATSWYEQAIDELEEDPSRNEGYVRWASRYLARPAFGSGDWAAAERYFSAALAGGRGSAGDFDQLAIARTRLGKYDSAVEAWKKAEELGPGDGNRPRYCAALAKMAATLGSLPLTDDVGRPWDKMGKEELEAAMAEHASLAKQTIAEALETAALADEARQEMQARIDKAQPLFVAAAMEYALQRYGIRETAFLGGYAPMIFHQKLWNLEIQLRKAKR